MRYRLLALADAESRLRQDLAQNGEGADGYPPRLRQLHEANARELELIIDDDGWPTPESAGDDGAEAAWMVAMHSVSRPAFMRRCLGLLRSAANRDDAPKSHAAMLEDRIRALEGQPQRYGTQLDWRSGILSPMPVSDPDGLDHRRAAVGLAPLAETIASARAAAQSDGAPPPEEWEAGSAVLDSIAREVGWRD